VRLARAWGSGGSWERGSAENKDAERRDREGRTHRGGHEVWARPVKTFRESAILKKGVAGL